MDQSFWANVKLISETLGYSDRKKKGLKRYQMSEIIEAFRSRKLVSDHLYNEVNLMPTNLGKELLSYLNKRSALGRGMFAKPMNRAEAKIEFDKIYGSRKHNCYLPMNKQKGDKKHPMYMTCIVNMLTEQALGDIKFDDNPNGLVVITEKGKPLRTLSRWMDGAFPSHVDPDAVWEIKEYYGTTTFGSRVADGVYANHA